MTPKDARTHDLGSGDGAAPDGGARDVVPPRAGLEGEPRTRPHWGRRVGFALLGLLGLIALVLVGGWLYLQSDAGRERVRGLVVGQIENLLADDATVTAESLYGSFLADAVLTGLEIRRGGETVVAVDTVLVDYNLTTLLDRTFSASQVGLYGPRVVVRQRADSTFNVEGLLLPREDTGQEPFAVVLDQVVVARGAADVVWYRADGRDSVHAVRDLGAVVEGFRSDADSLGGDIASVEARLLAPFGRGEIALEAGGRFSRSELVLRDLDVASRAGTDVEGRARLQFTSDGTLPVFDAVIAAAPLALEDARAFAGVGLYGDPRLRLRADSDGDLLTATLTGALDDATVNLDGEFSRAPGGGPVRYRAEGTVRRFNPAALKRNPALEAEVTGDLRLNLQGTTLEQLSGPFRVALRETRVGDRTIDRLRLDGSFAAGRVSFDLEGALPGATLSAEGLARPFDDVPTVQLAGTAQDVDLGALLPGSGRTDTFAGEFALIGRGSSLDTFDGEVALDLSRAEIGLPNHRLRLASTQIDADIADGLVGFDADVTLADGQGRVQGAGTLELGQPLRYAVEDGRATGLNLAALTGNPRQDSDLTGAFTLSGEGVDVRQAPIDLTADLGPSRFGAFDLAGGVLGVELRGGVADLDAALDFGAGGRLTATGTARPFEQPLAYSLSGTMTNLDLAVVQSNPDRASDLTGAFTADGAGLDPATLALDATVRITEPSSYGARLIDSADLAVTLDAGALTVDGVAATPEGEFDLALSGTPFGPDGPAFAFDRTCFRGLDASDFAQAAPRTRLNGCFSGSLSGLADLPTADADGVVTLRPSQIGDADVEDGRLVFALDDGALAGTLALELVTPAAEAGVVAGGRVEAAFEARPFQDAPSYAVRGRTEGLDAGSLLDLPPDQPLRLSATFDLSGRGTDPGTMTLQGAVEAAPSTVGPVALESLTAAFALEDGVVRVDTLALDSDLLVARGGGTLALFNDAAASDFVLEGAVESLAPFAARSDRALGLESGTFAFQASAGPGEPLRLLGTVEARQVVVDDYAATGLDASMNVTWDRARADSLGLRAFGGQVRASFAVLSGPTFRVEEGRATLRAQDGDVVVDGALVVDDRRDLDVSARVDLETNGVTLERGRFRLDDTTWQLLQPAGIAFDGSEIDVRGLLVASQAGGQQIAADGTIDLEGDQNLIVTVEDLSVDALTDFVDLDALGGDLTATVVLSGPARAPVLDGDVRLDDLTSDGRPVGALRADLDYAGGTLALDARLTHVDGQDLTVTGTVPVQFALADDGVEAEESGDRDAAVSLRARADAFPIAWAQPFLAERGYTDVGGTLRLDLTVEGTQGAPDLDGVATLTDGRLGVVATGRTYQPVQADLTFQNDRIVLDEVRVLDGGRTALDVTGSITLRELSVGELDLTVTPTEFVAMDTRTYDGLTLDRGTTPLRLTGTLDRPVLRGSVVLSQGDIYLTDELVPPDLETVELSDAQIRDVEARFGRVVTARDTSVNRFTDALDYDLTVEIERNVWLRSNAGLPFDIEFSGDVAARKTAFAESGQLFGQIDLNRGSVETLSRLFELTDGSIVFNGDALDALIDLSAELDVRLPGTQAGQSSATIRLDVDGRFAEDLTIRLSSTPALDQADIVSLIATGRLASEAFAGGGGGAFGTAAGLVGGYAGGLAEGFASETLGISMAQIDYEAGDLVIKLGDYLTSRAFLTFGVIVGAQDPNQTGLPIIVGLDYELLRWLSAQAEYSGQRGVGTGLNYEVAW